MSKMTIAQLEYLSQQLSQEFDTVKDLTSKAWGELTLARDTLRNISVTYDELLKEKELDRDH